MSQRNDHSPSKPIISQTQIIGDIYIYGEGRVNISQVGQAAPPSYYLNQAPPLPPHHVPLPDATERVRNALLAAVSEPVRCSQMIVIHGMGGLGKSTLAMDVCHDKKGEVPARFHDGILWITIGQRPNLLALLSDCIQVLGDYQFRPSTIEVAGSQLRSMLHERSALLVLDDVWDPAHVRPFLLSGSSRLLVTSREAEVARQFGAELYEQPLPNAEQALTLIKKRISLASTFDQQDEAAARSISHELGYLPLALELAAAQINDGLSFPALLRELRDEVSRLEILNRPEAADSFDEVERRRLSLRACFHMSLGRLPRQELERFAWLGVLPDDVSLSCDMVCTLWGNTERVRAQNLLVKLCGKALLQRGLTRPDETPTYRLHDLMHDEARTLLTQSGGQILQGFGIPLRDAHRQLIERYRARLAGTGWHGLPDDGYIHMHLVWHLENAELFEDIHALFAQADTTGRHAFYTSRERLGQSAGFLTDLNRAWTIADGEAAKERSARTLGLQSRYALIAASLNSLATSLPGELITSLVRAKIWNASQGLSYARQVRAAMDGARLLCMLSDVLPEPHRTQALEESVARIGRNPTAHRSDFLLTALAQRVDGQLWMRAWKLAQSLIASKPGNLDEPLTISFLPHAPPEMRTEVLQSTLHELKATFDGFNHRFIVFAPFRRLIAALPYLDDTTRQERIDAALPSLWMHRDKDDLAKAIVAIVAHVPFNQRNKLLERAMRLIKNSSQKVSRARGLCILLPVLPSDLRAAGWLDALSAARALKRKEDRATALSELLVHCKDEDREPLVAEALAVTRSNGSHETRHRVLQQIAGTVEEPLRSSLLHEAVASARQLREGKARSLALCMLAEKLPEEERDALLREAFDAAFTISDQEDCICFQAACLAFLPPPQAQPLGLTLLSKVREISNRYVRTRVFEFLAPVLSQKGVTEAVRVARQLMKHRDPFKQQSCHEALIPLIPRLPEATREQLLKELRRQLSEDDFRRVFSPLAACASPDEYQEVVTEILAFGSPAPNDTELIHRCATKLSWDQLSQAWQDAFKRKAQYAWKHECAYFISDMIERAPPALWPEALSMARQGNKCGASAADEDNAEAFVAVLAIVPEAERTSVLKEALEVTRRVRAQRVRATLLGKLIKWLPEPEQGELLEEALGLCRAQSSAIERAAGLVDVMAELPTRQRAAILSEVRASVQAVQERHDRANLQIKLLAFLPRREHEEQLREIFDALDFNAASAAVPGAHAIQERPPSLAGLLKAAAPYLTDDLRTRAMGYAWQLDSTEMIVVVLQTLASRAQHPLYPMVWDARSWSQLLRRSALAGRASVLKELTTLVPVIAQIGGSDGVAALYHSCENTTTWWPSSF